MASLLGLIDMVQRNTKEYIAASNMAWIAPRSAMHGSVVGAQAGWKGGRG